MRKLHFVSMLAIFGGHAVGQTYAQINNFNAGATGGYTQNFNGFGAGSVTLTPVVPNASSGFIPSNPEWMYRATGTNAAITSAPASTGAGSGFAGGLYNWGTTVDTADRALGTVGTSSYANATIAVGVVNKAAETGLVVLAFDIEQYRLGSSTANLFDGYEVSYALLSGSDPILVPTQLGVSSLFSTANLSYQTSTDDFATISNPVSGGFVPAPLAIGLTNIALNGNAPSNKVRVRMALDLQAAGKSWKVDDRLVFRFVDRDITGTDHGFGIDNVQIVPEPATVAMLGIGLAGIAARRRRK